MNGTEPIVTLQSSVILNRDAVFQILKKYIQDQTGKDVANMYMRQLTTEDNQKFELQFNLSHETLDLNKIIG